MRALRIITALLILGSAIAWADNVYSVEMTSTFVATQPCLSNCTETIAASFEWVETNNIIDSYVVPGTLWASANGFLGPLLQANSSAKDGYYIPVYDLYGDEIDINFSPMDPFMDIWSCKSSACIDGFNPPPYQQVGGFLFDQTFGWNEVSTVPEPSSFAMLLIVVGAMGVKFRRHREDTRTVHRSS